MVLAVDRIQEISTGEILNNILLVVIGMLGLVSLWMQRHTKKDVREAKRTAHEARQTAQDTNRQVTPRNGRTTAATIEEVLDEVRDIKKGTQDTQKEVKELRIEQADMAVTFGAHLIDGHDPIGRQTHRQDRRLGDAKDKTPE